MDWNAYRDVLAREAEKVIGQPVAVRGAADFSILPMPHLVLNDIAIGGSGGPTAEVESFEARVELLPLLGGKIKIAEMTVIRPKVSIVIDEAGRVDWQARGRPFVGPSPDAVLVDHVAIRNGELTVTDARTGAAFRFRSISTTLVEAPSLRGPWKVNGSLETLGGEVAFKAATGRAGTNGDIRVAVDLTPSAPYVAGLLTMDGTLRTGGDDLVYEGEFAYRKSRADGDGPANAADAAWRMAGAFRLDPRQLRVPSFTVNEGSGNTPFGISGALSVNFGATGQFAAEVTSQQIDLDRPLGEGGRADVPAALTRLMAEMARLPVPPIAGRVGVSIPAIVVGGGVIQTLSFDAIPADRAWQIRDMSVRLPGQSAITANGTVTIGAKPSFFGFVRVLSEQPAALTAWLGGPDGPRLRVSDLDVSARVHFEAGAFDAQNVEAKLGGADARGWVFWEGKAGTAHRLKAELKAERVHLDDLTTLGGFFASSVGPMAARRDETIELSFTAARVDTGDVALGDVSIVGSLTGDTLKVDAFKVGDVGGGSLVVEGGQIAALSTSPRGRIAGRFEAGALGGVASLVEHLWPDSAGARWLRQSGPELVPVSMYATVTAGAPGEGDVAFDLTGSVGGSSLAASARVTGNPLAWRTAPSEVSVVVENRAAAELARQFGLPALAIGATPAGRLEFHADGVAEKGMETHIAADFAGTRLDIDGTLAMKKAGAELDGRFGLESSDIDPLLLIAGQTLPGIGNGTPASLTGAVTAGHGRASLSLGDRSSIDRRPISGAVAVARGGDGWQLSGQIGYEAIDLAWLASIGLGVAPELGGEGATRWSTLPFGRPAIAGLRGGIDLKLGRLALGPALSLGDAALTLTVEPSVLTLDLIRGGFSGGSAEGSLSIRNPAGNAAVKGRVAVAGTDPGPLLWPTPGGPVLTGDTSLAADFEATGSSTAELVASLTGTGEIAVTDGRIRGFEPALFATIAREAEDGRSFTSAEIAERFAGSAAADGMAFERATARLAIVAGTVGVRDIAARGHGVALSGEADIELTSLTVDGEFPLTAVPPDGAPEGPAPSVAIGVSGTLDAPATTIDGAPLARYLAMRTLERFEQLQDEELERDRLFRLLRKQREDAARSRGGAGSEPGAPESDPPGAATEPDVRPSPILSGPLPQARPLNLPASSAPGGSAN